MEEYKSEGMNYEQVRYKTVLAILKSQFDIEVNDFNGLIQIKKEGKLIADVQIENQSPT